MLYVLKFIHGTGIAILPAMKAAISHSNGRIAPVFDVSENLFLIDMSDSGKKERKSIVITGKEPFERARELSTLGVSVLICGAISGVQETAVRSAGIEVLGFVCGEVESVISAFIEGSLTTDGPFMMPGCCGRRRMHRHGRCCVKKSKHN